MTPPEPTPEPLPAASEAVRARHATAHDVIPGGAHTYAKGDDQYPATAPPFLVRGQGPWVFDADGRRYIEYGSGLRSVTLGHAHPAVVEAVSRAVADGTNFVRPSTLELEAAEDLLDFLGRPGWMVKFGKNGSDCTSAAVRLARAATGRDVVAVCADHPFFSVDDWFIATTPMDAGIPQAVRDLTVTFPYGDLDALDDVLTRHPVAAVVMEAAKHTDPPPGYLAGVRERCTRAGTVLVLDEMITGLRWPGGSAMAAYDLDPDLATFGKALGNGISVSALVGRPELMERGGIRTPHPRVFLLSLTHGAETTGLAAARAVLRTYREEDVVGTLATQGTRLAEAVTQVAADLGVHDTFEVVGFPSNLVFTVRDPAGEPSQAHRTLLLQELIRRGVIGPSLVLGATHDDAVVDATATAFAGALAVHRRALEDGVERFLVGPPSKVVFRRRA